MSTQDLVSLQQRLAAASEVERPPLELLAQCVQTSMEARMESAAKDLEALLMSSGNIDQNIRDCLAEQDSPLPLLAVLQMNLGRAQRDGNERQARALDYIFRAMNAELEQGVPLVSRILSRLVTSQDVQARRQLLHAFIADEGQQQEGRIAELASAINKLALEAESTLAEDTDKRGDTLRLIRAVALDAGIVIAEDFGDEAGNDFASQLQPMFEALQRL